MRKVGTNGYHLERAYDWSETRPSTAILEVLAAAEDVYPGDLHVDPGIRLSESVDSEALDALVTSGSGVRVSFSVARYRIHVEENRVTIRAAETTSG